MTTREIKFRVWDMKKKQPMIYFGSGFELDDDNDSLSFTTEKHTAVMGDHDLKGDRFILMQYTGLKDKTGKEIYEGDILHPTFADRAQAVTFEKGSFSTRSGFDLAKAEIIGNIYENPDLLEAPQAHPSPNTPTT